MTGRRERVTVLAEFVREQQALDLPTMKVELYPLNGTYYLTATVDANRRRDEAARIADLIRRVNAELPASRGLHTHPYGLNALGSSADDLGMLAQLNQGVSILVEHGQTNLFGPEGTML